VGTRSTRSGRDYAAQIGGTAIDTQGTTWVVGTHKIAVTRLQARPIFARFTLEQVYQEVQDEADPTKFKQGRLL
jgi:hypothetical protein